MQVSWQSPCALVWSSFRVTGSVPKSDCVFRHLFEWPDWISLERHMMYSSAEKSSGAASEVSLPWTAGTTGVHV